MKGPPIPQSLQPWIEARARWRLSHVHVQMARELGMNPKKLGKLNPGPSQRWKLPLPAFIEDCYLRRFHRDRPETVRSIEEIARMKESKNRIAKQERAQQGRAAAHDAPPQELRWQFDRSIPTAVTGVHKPRKNGDQRAAHR